MLIEALQHGVPVIASDIKGNRELIEHEKNGLLVKYDDEKGLVNAIIRILKNKVEADRFSSSGKKNLQKFQLDYMLNSTTDLLKKLASKKDD